MGAIKYSPAAPIIVRVNHGERSNLRSLTCPLLMQPRRSRGAPAVPVPGPDKQPAPAWILQQGPMFPPLALGDSPGLSGSRGGDRADGTANTFAYPEHPHGRPGRSGINPARGGDRRDGQQEQRAGWWAHVPTAACPARPIPPSVTWRPRGDLCRHLAFCSHSPWLGVLQPCQGPAGRPLPACCLRCHTRAPASLLFIRVGTRALFLHLPLVLLSVLPSVLPF